jgi:hypothetical protein
MHRWRPGSRLRSPGAGSATDCNIKIILFFLRNVGSVHFHNIIGLKSQDAVVFVVNEQLVLLGCFLLQSYTTATFPCSV